MLFYSLFLRFFCFHHGILHGRTSVHQHGVWAQGERTVFILSSTGEEGKGMVTAERVSIRSVGGMVSRRGMKAKVDVGKSFATMVVFRGLFLHGLVDERQRL
ncbi:hypothetical protein BKA56DRAFT_275678 [Ilyonectria sp. MPI-CAGE-AT-0026]|nr:hypothetical protein BKA56DRAFT_275678 [Ilyonectria sp. MPI-CAGE-AT-0026]